jgi:hypothetical protein
MKKQRAGFAIAGLTLVLTPAALAQDAGPTFYRDVAPILQERCQSCHRAGEIGPMPLGTYAEVRPFARAIKNAVVTKKMPPWFADPAVGRFHNDPSLSQRQIDVLARWADDGAAAGDPKDAPPPRVFADGWNIGAPDVVLEMPQAYVVPARGTVEYTYVIVPTGFKTDTWVSAAEVRPGDRAVMHHATIFMRPKESSWLRKYPAGQPFVPSEQIRSETTPTPAATTNAGAGALDVPIVGYVPGRPAKLLRPGYGILIPAGADLVFQLHYTANGKDTPDRSRVGFLLARERPSMQVLRVAAGNDQFVIPPGADDFAVSGFTALGVDAELIEAYPHMHVRGKSMKLSALYPGGKKEELLNVPRYDFNWQLTYEMTEPKRIPKGTIFRADGTFNNSTSNRFNPDPSKEVRWGDQSWDEMLVGFFQIAVPAGTDPQTIIMRR